MGRGWSTGITEMNASSDIKSHEAKSLLPSLRAFRDHIHNSLVDVHAGGWPFENSLENFWCKFSSVNEPVREILVCSCWLNV